MKHTWIKNDNTKLIVFFNGWGCDEHQFTHLNANDYDVLMLNDYRNLTLDNSVVDAINTYREINIAAWSYGVWVAQYMWGELNLSKHKAVAINGTTMPVSKAYGIPEIIMQGTLDNLSERNMMKFQRRMVGGSEGWKAFETIKPQRDITEQKEELAALIQHFKTALGEESFYDKAIVASGDLIFSADNQKQFWNDKAEVKEIEAAHYCFFDIENWDSLLS
ncbi:DUF452 family protein [Labilibacter marinus]|uniref:DUF452 family protein n=1 Tax=Labilibacter marinus TaxID=1477105 RepID=UPI00082C2A83|nr:pimeloyl-ACP methyl esterase BioG family protein [Labilibacter marinus]